jgi:hypothetical protein
MGSHLNATGDHMGMELLHDVAQGADVGLFQDGDRDET